MRQYYLNAKTRGQLFCNILRSFAPSSVCSWRISCFASLTGKWWNDTVFISSHFIKWFMISLCPNIDDVHLDHLIKVVAVKLLRCQVTLSYLVIETFFCVLKDIYNSSPKFRFVNLIKSIWLIASYFTKGIMIRHYHCLYWCSYFSSLRQWEPP